jgi:hypothetical protein
MVLLFVVGRFGLELCGGPRGNERFVREPPSLRKRTAYLLASLRGFLTTIAIARFGSLRCNTAQPVFAESSLSGRFELAHFARLGGEGAHVTAFGVTLSA